MRTTAEKRHNDYTKAIRKRKIDRETQPSGWNHDWYNNLHQYNKNKIHCSCPMCSVKTNNRGHNGWKPNTLWSITDQKKLDALQYNEEDE